MSMGNVPLRFFHSLIDHLRLLPLHMYAPHYLPTLFKFEASMPLIMLQPQFSSPQGLSTGLGGVRSTKSLSTSSYFWMMPFREQDWKGCSCTASMRLILLLRQRHHGPLLLLFLASFSSLGYCFLEVLLHNLIRVL